MQGTRPRGGSRLGAGDCRRLACRDPEGAAQSGGLGGDRSRQALKGTLRPYQQVGLRWLYLLAKLGLGACLADDMGLGKTIQVLSLLLVLKKQSSGKPSLLVAPASLLANWAAELERFAPSLKVMIAHTSAVSGEELKNMPADSLADVDVVITSYGSLLRLPWLTETCWRLAVLDEAQAIKNPSAKQTRSHQATEGRFALCADRHAGRKPAGRSVVHLRLHQSRPAGIGPRSSPSTPSASPSGPTIPTGRCASWCARIFCGG
jgi:SNF2 family DNA or RNA helicase